MVRKIYGTQLDDPMEDLNVNFAILENVHVNHSSSNGSSRKRLQHESTTREEPSLEFSGTIIR